MSTLTVTPCRTSPRDDAIALRRAFTGVSPDSNSFIGQVRNVIGCDVRAVVEILAHRDATERVLIQRAYKEMYSADILEHLSLQLGGKLKTSVLLWMHVPAERDARVVKQGLCSAYYKKKKKLKVATEVICSRKPSQIESLKEQYHSIFGVDLEKDIELQASGDHEKLLLAYVSRCRDEGRQPDRKRAAEDSMALFRARELGTDVTTFINIFSEQSREQLAAVIPAYHNVYGNSLKKAVKGKKWEELFKYALLTILSCSKNLARFFAKVLHKAMQGMGTNNTILIWVIVTRTEIDMQHIKDEYLKKYKKTLYDAVYRDTSGCYRDFLLALLGSKH